MKAHELAKLLLDGPDVDVVYSDDQGFCEVESVGVEDAFRTKYGDIDNNRHSPDNKTALQVIWLSA